MLSGLHRMPIILSMKLILKMMKTVRHSSNTGEVKPKKVCSSPFSREDIFCSKKDCSSTILSKRRVLNKRIFTNNVNASEFTDTAVKNFIRSSGKTN